MVVLYMISDQIAYSLFVKKIIAETLYDGYYCGTLSDLEWHDDIKMVAEKYEL